MFSPLDNTLFIGKHVIFHPVCTSTNTRLQEESVVGTLKEGTVLITDCQTAGRGQRGKTWETEQGKNLTFSLLLYPKLPIDRQFMLTRAISLALADYAGIYVSPLIKWPNDLMVGNDKMAGILIENTIAGQCIDKSIVGIGFNINQTAFRQPGITSLSAQIGRRLSLQDEFARLLAAIEYRVDQLRKGHDEAIEQAYKAYLFGLGERRQFYWNDKPITGKVQGVDGHGRLLLLVDGITKAFDMQEVTWVFR